MKKSTILSLALIGGAAVGVAAAYQYEKMKLLEKELAKNPFYSAKKSISTIREGKDVTSLEVHHNASFAERLRIAAHILKMDN